MVTVIYKIDNVEVAAKKRISTVFDNFDNIVVSISSGKDSSVLYYLVLAEAIKRNRKIKVFFLDQEAEYESSIFLIEKMMIHPNIEPLWFQVPLKMTNATSNIDYFLNAWGDGEQWIREKNKIAIKKIEKKYPDRFYSFFEWYEKQFEEKTAFLIGLRSKESLNRFRAVTKSAGYENIFWSTKTKNKNVFRFYPIYDWCFPDVWKYIYDNKIEYNKMYDFMFIKNGNNISNMRVSNLIHEKSFKCLTDLQEFEPETYEKLIKRIGGIHCASMYAKEDYIYSCDKRPKRFTTWKQYRDYLIETTPIDKKERFIKRFQSQVENEDVFRQQCKQILLNDWDNSLTVDQKKAEKSKEKLKKWYDIL